MNKEIKIVNAWQNNLKHISLNIPYYKLSVVTGNSGSGKSSLVYDTIYAESQRLVLESLIDNTFGQKLMDKPNVDRIENLCPAISISQNSYNFNPSSTVSTYTDINHSLRNIYSIISSDEKKKIISFRDFLPSQSKFRCKHCKGTGFKFILSEKKMIPNLSVSLEDGGIIYFSGKKNSYVMRMLYAVCQNHNIDIHKSVGELTEYEKNILLYGDEQKYKIIFNVGGKTDHQKTVSFVGAINALNNDFKKIDHPMFQKQLDKYIEKVDCEYCSGTGFDDFISSIRVCGLNIFEVSNIEIKDVLDWCKQVEANYKDKKYFPQIYMHTKYISALISFMIKLDIDYLSLNRSIPSLSGGEFQRLRLARQATCSLCEILYILDEPCRGLHKIDVNKIINISKELTNRGNTVIAIEHNLKYINAADNIISIGPGSGPLGGELCKYSAVDDDCNENFPSKNKRKTGVFFEFKNINVNNIHNESCNIPINLITFVTGVSGSGKSSFVREVVYKSFKNNFPINCKQYISPIKPKKIYYVNQNPIGKNVRSTIISYLNIYDDIREVFSKASNHRYKSSFFSTNCEGGRCEKCSGNGVITVKNNYFPDSDIICDECEGKRFQAHILEVEYKGKNINDVLSMSINEARSFFSDIKKIDSMLKCIQDIGLGYLKLGQMSKNLSGGESQRLKLAKAIGEETSIKDNVYLLDEPTAGLSEDDQKKIGILIQNLADKGNTLIIIDHNCKFINENADYIIDFGILGGKNGGKVFDCGYIYDAFKRKKASIWI